MRCIFGLVRSERQQQPLTDSPSCLFIPPSLHPSLLPPLLWHGSLSLVLSSPTHGFNFGRPASRSPAIMYLVSSHGSAACFCALAGYVTQPGQICFIARRDAFIPPPIPHMHASVCIAGLARKWTGLAGLKKKGSALNLLSF